MRFTSLTSRDEVQDLIRWHNEHSKHVVIDVETTSTDARCAELIDVQISGQGEDSAAIFPADYADALLLLKPDILLVGHNCKYDIHVLVRHGVNLLDRTWRDTMLLGHLLDENRESYSLDSYVQEIWKDGYKEKFWANHKSYQEASAEARREYACRDIVYTERLFNRHMGEMERPDAKSLWPQLVSHVHALADALVRTEIEGLEVDLDYLTQLGVKLGAKLEQVLPQMRQLVEPYVELCELEDWEKQLAKYKTDKGRANCPRPVFSFDSPRQLINLLYGQLGLPPQKNDKTKNVSVDEASLENLAEAHPLIPLLLEYRGLQKVQGTYIQGTLERMINGRIFPEFRVNGTKTGRISHSNPNLGQLPKSGGIRGIYRAAQGQVLLSADYSQLEVCIEANLTGDKSLARIFQEGLSKHDITAQALKIDRHAAKTLNFALQYWASHFKVAQLLGVSKDEGKKIWEDYWLLYRGPKALKAQTDKAVDSGIPLVTRFGRKRRFERRRRNAWDSDYRQAYNFLIQGTGADITSRAFYLVGRELRERGWGRALFTVHDEILIEVKENFAQEAEALLLETMVGVGEEIGLKIPLKAESSGPMRRWED